MNEAQTRKDLIDPAIEKAGWTKASLPLFAGERLEVGFPKVLDAAEEGDFGFCQPVAGRQLQIGEFKCAKDIGQLKETVEAIAKPAAASAVSSKPPYLFRENRCNSGRAASTMPPL